MSEIANKSSEKSDDEILFELEHAHSRQEAREIRRKYAASRITGRQSIRLLSSLERLGMYFQILVFAVYMFAGYVSYSERIVYGLYDLSIVSGVFILLFSLAGIAYAIFKSVKSKASPVGFILLSLVRIAVMLALVSIETALKLLSNGGLFSV